MTDNVIDLARHRKHVLDYLRDGPLAKHSIIDALDYSRSTVDRAIDQLAAADLITQQNGGYETTVTGVLALELSRRNERNATALATTAPMVKPLWKEESIAMAFLRGAEGTLLRESDSVTPLSGLQSALRNSSDVRALLPTVPTGDHLDLLRSRVLRDGTSVRLVCSTELFDRLREQRPGWLREFVIEGEGELSTATVPEFAVYVADIADRTVAFLLVYDGEVPHALLQNESDEAVEWATGLFAEHEAGAQSARERVEQIPREEVFRSPHDGSPVLGTRRASAAGQASESAPGEDLLAAGYAIDSGKLRTPKFGADGACTVAFWMLPYSFDDGWELMVKWDYLAVGYRHGKLYAGIYDPGAETSRARVDRPIEQFDLTRWTHVAYTYDEQQARLFVDGELVVEREDDYPVSIEPLGACLGYMYEQRDTGVHEPEYTGRLADVRFYGSALDAESVRQLHRTTAPE